jgi:hypothetical protein
MDYLPCWERATGAVRPRRAARAEVLTAAVRMAPVRKDMATTMDRVW